MKIAVFYVGSSLLSPLRRAEADINARYDLGLELSLHNCGAALANDEWEMAARDIRDSKIIFVIHVTDGENASRLVAALDPGADQTVLAFNCMPDLMRRTRLGKLRLADLMKQKSAASGGRADAGQNLVRRLASWMADAVKSRSGSGDRRSSSHHQYAKLVTRLPRILKFVPAGGRLRDVKHYLNLYGYFLQPSPNNIRRMLLYAIKHCAGSGTVARVNAPESIPATGVYHPDATGLFERFDEYRRWYESRGLKLDPANTIGLLLMRPNIVSEARGHYDFLIRAIEDEGLAVVPAISTFMDNRDACGRFFAEDSGGSRVSQIVSLTGFSFVGGPAMNDSDASVEFFKTLGVPYRSMVSLDFQTIQSWDESRIGVNPVQSAMQVAIPEIDGSTEPFVFGGLSAGGSQPMPIEERCRRVARRLARWNRLRNSPRDELRLAFVLFCFPPNKGNIGTAADLDVFPSLVEIFGRLSAEGYRIDAPDDPDTLRELVLQGNSGGHSPAGIAYRMKVDEYRRVCPYVDDIEAEWGPPPGRINSSGREMLIHGMQFGSVFVGVQPTFGYEGDPMRMLMAESGAPHHGFAAFYSYLAEVFCADAVVHVGTHGALEFMPGKQAGLSSRCWPDRLIGELPNIYIYSVNNPSEGTIAKRRSYAELVSYLTPPVESAGLYRDLAELKELIGSYRRAGDESELEQLFAAISEKARALEL